MSAPRVVEDPRDPPWPEEEWPKSRPVSETPRDLPRLPFEPLEAFLARAEAEPEPGWLVEDLVPNRGVAFLVAEPSAGKTWLALIAAKAAAAQGRAVFVIEEEDSARNLGDRLRKLGMAGPVQLLHRGEFLIDDEVCRRALLVDLQAALAPVVVFDPFTSLHQGNENDTEHANAVRRCLTEVANANPDSLVIVCHHTSKNTETSEMYRGRGSSVFAGFADVQLNLKHIPTKKEEQRVAFEVTVAKCRHGHRGLKRDVSIPLDGGQVGMEPAGEKTDEELDTRILAAFKKAQGGLMRSAVVDVVRRNRDRVFARIKAMLEDGRLEEFKTAEGKRVVRPPATYSPEVQ